MSLRALLTALLLPPVGFALAALALALLAWRGRRWAGLVAALLLALQVALATPFATLWLRVSLQAMVPSVEAAPPGAIVVLGADMARAPAGIEPGPLTLERLRAAAVLHRRTGLPVLVTAGPPSREVPMPLAQRMAEVLTEEFGVAVRWVEPQARDTIENARFSTALLREAGIGSAYVVTHAWHVPRALAAFRRNGIDVVPAAVRPEVPPAGRFAEFVPRADHWAASWLAVREWAGLLLAPFRSG